MDSFPLFATPTYRRHLGYRPWHERAPRCLTRHSYAAGCAKQRILSRPAAAMAAQQGIGTAEIDVAELQQRLIDLKHLSDEVLGMEDSFPLPDTAVSEMISTDLNSLKSIAAAFAGEERYWPHIEAQLANADHQQSAALILGLQGSAVAAPSLQQQIKDIGDWDEGWRFTGMGQFGKSLSALDCMLVALARCGDESDAELLQSFANKLPENPAFSHVRALAWACDIMANRFPTMRAKLGELLEAIIQLDGMSGWHWTSLERALSDTDDDVINTRERECALRELHLAVGAVRCGATGPALQTLNHYRNDVRGHFAKHGSTCRPNKYWCRSGQLWLGLSCLRLRAAFTASRCSSACSQASSGSRRKSKGRGKSSRSISPHKKSFTGSG